MTWTPSAPKLARMGGDVVRAALELQPGVDPIAGTIRDEKGGTSEFTSWLALVHHLERLRVTGEVTSAPPSEAT